MANGASTDAEHSSLQSAWSRLNDAPLSSFFVLKTDFVRLAVVWLYGGWWLDADALCVDSITQALHCPTGPVQKEARRALDLHGGSGQCVTPLTGRGMLTCASHRGRKPRSPKEGGCLFAWEGDVKSEHSSPLQWAFGCRARHPFLMRAMRLLSQNVLAWRRDASVRGEASFMARGSDSQGSFMVDVLHVTGPGMVRRALQEYARDSGGLSTLRALREHYGEVEEDSETWARASVVGPESNSNESVVILPYCFFRSRGCRHLLAPYNDTVVYHHEFDTSWRTSFWHNYHHGTGLDQSATSTQLHIDKLIGDSRWRFSSVCQRGGRGP